QVYRAGLPFVAVERAAGDSRDLLIANHRLTIGYNGDFAANQGDVIGMPNVRSGRGNFARRNETVDTTVQQGVGLRIARAVFDLHLVAAPQVHPGVTSFGKTEFEVQLEVFKFLLRYQVSPRLRVSQDTVADGPL